jgi:hypothetical protein
MIVNQPRRFKAVCRALALLFLIVGAGRLAWSVATWANPLYGAAVITCEPCTVETDPVRLLGSEQARINAWRTAGSDARIRERVQVPKVRGMLLAAELIRGIPLSLLFVSLAFALNSLASAGFNERAVRWLRRAALAGIFWVLGHPLAESIRATAMSPVTHGVEGPQVVLAITPVFWAAMVVGATWICLRAMEEALAFRRDLEEII